MRDNVMIKTERLSLRPLRFSDAQRVARFCGDPGVAGMILYAPIPYLGIAAEGWIMTLRARAGTSRDLVLAADLAGEGLVGIIGAHAGEDEAFEVGYWFGRPYWGQGLASETLNAFLRAAQGLGPLQAGHFVDNPASGRVLEKGGFAYTGETEILYSLGRGARVTCKRMRYAPSGARRASQSAELKQRA